MIELAAHGHRLVDDVRIEPAAAGVLRPRGHGDLIVGHGAFQKRVGQVVLESHGVGGAFDDVEKVDDFRLGALRHASADAQRAFDHLQRGVRGAKVVGRDVATLDRRRQVEHDVRIVRPGGCQRRRGNPECRRGHQATGTRDCSHVPSLLQSSTDSRRSAPARSLQRSSEHSNRRDRRVKKSTRRHAALVAEVQLRYAGIPMMAARTAQSAQGFPFMPVVSSDRIVAVRRT